MRHFTLQASAHVPRFSSHAKLPRVFTLPCSSWSTGSHVMHVFHSTVRFTKACNVLVASSMQLRRFRMILPAKMLFYVPCLLATQSVSNVQSSCAPVASCTKPCTCTFFVALFFRTTHIQIYDPFLACAFFFFFFLLAWSWIQAQTSSFGLDAFEFAKVNMSDLIVFRFSFKIYFEFNLLPIRILLTYKSSSLCWWSSFLQKLNKYFDF